MNIKERIERLGMYFHSMNVAAENNIIYVRVQFPKGWGCSELTEYNFNVKSVTDEIPGYFYFFANMEIGFDKIFDAIEFNIQFNEEAQAKVSLLREKIEELKDIFENEDINVLRTLEFKYKKKKPKSIKSQKTVTEEPKEIVEPVSETPILEENNSDKIDNK
jgi:hypothetical protein